MEPLELVGCPHPGCEHTAEVVSRWVAPLYLAAQASTGPSGTLAHMRVRCLDGHVYAGPTELMERAGA